MESEDLVTYFLSWLKIFKLMKIEELLSRMSLFTDALKKGSLHVNIQLNVINRINAKTELMLWSCKYFLKCHD